MIIEELLLLNDTHGLFHRNPLMLKAMSERIFYKEDEYSLKEKTIDYFLMIEDNQIFNRINEMNFDQKVRHFQSFENSENHAYFQLLLKLTLRGTTDFNEIAKLNNVEYQYYLSLAINMRMTPDVSDFSVFRIMQSLCQLAITENLVSNHSSPDLNFKSEKSKDIEIWINRNIKKQTKIS